MAEPMSHPLEPDYGCRCEICGESPVVPITGLCGPCSYGSAENANAAWRRSLPAACPSESTPIMTRDEALLRLADELPDEAFASVQLTAVALTSREVAGDLRSGKPARFSHEWTVLITAPGFSGIHSGDELGPVVEQALADYAGQRTAKDAEEWARSAIPDKPPKLRAPGTAHEREQPDREKDAG